MFRKLVLNILVLNTIITSIVNGSPTGPIDMNSNSISGGEFSVIQKVYDDCQDKQDFTDCLKGKALVALSRAVEQDSIQLVDGVLLVKQNENDVDSTPILSDARTLSSFSGIDRELIQKVDRFLRTHVLKVDMADEARGKGKKHHKYIIAALLTAMGIAGPIGLKALAAIAGKALVISKVALTIAGIIALKKIFSHDHHEETSFHVQSSGHDNRRNTYVVRPVKPAGGVAAPGVVDPYRYYYDQQYANVQKPEIKYNSNDQQ